MASWSTVFQTPLTSASLPRTPSAPAFSWNQSSRGTPTVCLLRSPQPAALRSPAKALALRFATRHLPLLRWAPPTYNGLLKKDVPPPGRDGHAQDKDAKSVNSSAIYACRRGPGATEDEVLRRPVRSGGRDIVLQQPAKLAAQTHGLGVPRNQTPPPRRSRVEKVYSGLCFRSPRSLLGFASRIRQAPLRS